MAPDSNQTSNRVAAQAIEAKLRELLEARERELANKSEIDKRIRRIDRDLWDCRAAGRLFGLEVKLPEDVRPALIIKARPAPPSAVTSAPPAPLPPPPIGPVEAMAELPLSRPPVPPPLPPGYELAPPTIRELVLSLLQGAGTKGSKAGPIRRTVEAALNRQIHYKTIGMTLYRLSQENLAHRDGFTWFFGPSPSDETKKPGGGSPGPLDDVTE